MLVVDEPDFVARIETEFARDDDAVCGTVLAEHAGIAALFAPTMLRN